MEQTQLNWIVNFIWGIADDVLRDLYVRGKYRDVILPMTVLRRLDAELEPTKQKVLEMKATLDRAGIVHQDQALRQAAGQAFYNTSSFTLRDLRNRASQQQLKADFEAYLDGFSPNVQDILENFELRNQIPRLSKADALGTLIEKLLSPDINLSPSPVFNGDSSVKHPGLDNHAMGTIFEELVRRFYEENNEEAGEHWTPRDAVKLMAKLIFLPIAEEIESGTYLLYDGACGTGGMLTVAEETLRELATAQGKQVATHLYGQEINAETYAICKADLLLKGEVDAADNIVGGPEHSTLSSDAFPSREFDFMLSNPPYGKSWKSDQERMGGKKEMRDPRFIIEHDGDPEYSLITRSSDGQMLFLANMLNKMKRGTALGSRIAEVHNGSSLFTGDAGQGESNIRRWIIENDWLEAIVALPLNMFYNTGIATYIWVLSNRKPVHRRGTVQLIDATQWYQPLRKNLGKKNCELSEEDIQCICDTFLAFKENEQSKIFPNAAFGYWKVTVERPLRLTCDLTDPNRAHFRAACVDVGEEALADVIDQVAATLGAGPQRDFNLFLAAVETAADAAGVNLSPQQITRPNSNTWWRVGLVATLPLYPVYKDSGVPWLGEIPAHWARMPGRACYRENKVPNTGMREATVLSLSYGQIVVKPPEKLHGLVPTSFETYQIIDPGDIIVRPTDLQNDWNSLRFGLSRHRGIITSAYMCLHTEDVITREYGHLLLHAYDLKKVFYGLGSGLRQNLDWRDFKYLPCLVPPPDEQHAITHYLDHMDRRIRRYIRAKQKLIALLEEQKQAIIHQAVTRGLDPNVRLKPSVVEWLGMCPSIGR